ncbi:hypothetical protein GCM10022214_13750 [Actinomadura miaoliensis]|uniref:Uncharacterized protein n=1 Tax=Actinomadura miaoliensis TaxID=430685 RepID=A0ABP7V973_9ACTN
MIQRFLVEVDPAWGRRQYAQFRRLFVVTRLGLPAIAEYPPGLSGQGDVDSGPLILGVSASATVVALGAARVHGDDRLAGPLYALGETAGLPVRLPKTKRYAFGTLPVGDAFLAWSATARPVTQASYSGVVSPWWRTPWHLLSLALVAALWFPFRRRRPARTKSENPLITRPPPAPGPEHGRRPSPAPVPLRRRGGHTVPVKAGCGSRAVGTGVHKRSNLLCPGNRSPG